MDQDSKEDPLSLESKEKHMGERPIIVNIVKRYFGGSLNFGRHTQTHAGQQPFCYLLHMKSFTRSS